MRRHIVSLTIVLSILSGCSLFETPVPTPVAIPSANPREELLSALEDLSTTPTGTFELRSTVTLSNQSSNDSINVTASGTFSSIINALRAQTSISVSLPNDTDTPIKGLLTTDVVFANQKALIRLISAQFAGSNSSQVNNDFSSLNNIWIHVSMLDVLWPPQKLLQQIFANNQTPWQNFLDIVEIVDQSRVQMSDHQAMRIIVSLKKDQLLNVIRNNTPSNLSPEYVTRLTQFLNLATWQGEFLVNSSSHKIESMSGIITIPGQYNNNTTLKIDYQINIRPDSEAKTIVPTITDTLEFNQLFPPK